MHIVNELNLSAFIFFNKNFGQPIFKNLLSSINAIGDPHYFHFHLIFIFIIGSILIYRKKNKIPALTKLLQQGISSSLTAIISLSVGLLLIVNILKIYTHVLRPHCSLENIFVLKHVIDSSTCQHSFPSGHIAYAIIMIFSFWPLFSQFFKATSIILLCILMISRMASGAHYPIDIIGSIFICLPLTLYIRMRMDKYTAFYISKWNIFSKFI